MQPAALPGSSHVWELNPSIPIQAPKRAQIPSLPPPQLTATNNRALKPCESQTLGVSSKLNCQKKKKSNSQRQRSLLEVDALSSSFAGLTRCCTNPLLKVTTTGRWHKEPHPNLLHVTAGGALPNTLFTQKSVSWRETEEAGQPPARLRPVVTQPNSSHSSS